MNLIIHSLQEVAPCHRQHFQSCGSVLEMDPDPDPDPAFDLNDQDLNPAFSQILIQIPAGVTSNTIQLCCGSVLEMDPDPAFDLNEQDLYPALSLILIQIIVEVTSNAIQHCCGSVSV